MKNQVFVIRDNGVEVWRVCFNGTVLSATWPERGSALACLQLLERGKGTVTEDGGVRWQTGAGDGNRE